MKHTRSRRRVRRVTRRRGGNENKKGILRRTGNAIRGCLGSLCGSTRGRTEARTLNASTETALEANRLAREAQTSYYNRLYGAYTGLPGMRANSVLWAHQQHANNQARITAQRKNAVLLIEQKEIDRLKSELPKLKRRGSIEAKEAEIAAAEARKKQIEGMTHNQLVGK